MRIVSYLVILFGFALVLYGAWFSLTLREAFVGLALMVFGTAGLVDNAVREVKSLRE